MVHLCLVNCYSLDNVHKLSIPINGIHGLIRPNKHLQRCIIMNTHRKAVQVPNYEVPSLALEAQATPNTLHYVGLGTTFYANSLVQSFFLILFSLFFRFFLILFLGLRMTLHML